MVQPRDLDRAPRTAAGMVAGVLSGAAAPECPEPALFTTVHLGGLNLHNAAVSKDPEEEPLLPSPCGNAQGFSSLFQHLRQSPGGRERDSCGSPQCHSRAGPCMLFSQWQLLPEPLPESCYFAIHCPSQSPLLCVYCPTAWTGRTTTKEGHDSVRSRSPEVLAERPDRQYRQLDQRRQHGQQPA